MPPTLFGAGGVTRFSAAALLVSASFLVLSFAPSCKRGTGIDFSWALMAAPSLDASVGVCDGVSTGCGDASVDCANARIKYIRVRLTGERLADAGLVQPATVKLDCDQGLSRVVDIPEDSYAITLEALDCTDAGATLGSGATLAVVTEGVVSRTSRVDVALTALGDLSCVADAGAGTDGGEVPDAGDGGT